MACNIQQPTIVMTPPDHPQPSSLHPRRPPAHRSVSLRHSPRSRLAQNATGADSSSSESKGDRSSGSPSSLKPNGKNSSGESSNAENWFEKSNNEVREQSKGFNDNDPPFFMRNSSSSETPPDGQQQHLQRYLGNDAAQSLPLRTGMLRLGTDGSSTEDFRSVIDDLTVENKKLKRRLKKYEKLHDSHLKDEKLFEIRVHGLAGDKKRELEELLRNFAGSLNGGTGPEFPANGYEGILPGLKSHKTASSQTSLHNTDSAYASMSASGQGSSSQPTSDSKPKNITQFAESRQQNIQLYLHHIPEGLMPHQNPAHMSEPAKKKMVVNRLEQIFAGKGALAGPHHQALQQQDVSQMAAHADRTASEEQGQRSSKEGHREAPIMQRETEDPLDPSTLAQGYQTEARNHQDAVKVEEHDFAGQSPKNSSPDQRPTRPLDLDPDRAQVPADNLRYIRHLGFSPKDPEYHHNYEEGHGWVYLNLLVNMAQLHTINVTADFVRKALTEYSDHFELSSDGRKVRWSGGAAMTRTSSQAGVFEPRVDDTQSPRKRAKLAHSDSVRSRAPTGSQRWGGSSVLQQENNKLMYTPLFYHRSSTEDSDNSSEEHEDTMSSDFPQLIGGDSSGMTSSGVRTISTKKHKKRDNGPIIFYNNARFCTDLSGDPEAKGNPGAPNYKLWTATPIGKVQPTTTERTMETRGPLNDAKQLPEPMDLSDNPIPDSMELSFPPPSSPRSETKFEDLRPIRLEVTGMGGIYPADNFAIAVESRHARVDQAEAPTVSVKTASKNVPERFAKIFEEGNPNRKVRGAVNQQVLKVKHIEHPPSELPPALSFMPFADDEEDFDDDSEAGDEMSLSPPSPGAFPPSAAHQTIEMPDAESDDSDADMADASDEFDAGSDDSLDLLAAARKVDPEAIRQKEREYDAEMAERLAEEIPAGSSAATVGGGSGFASPASGIDKEDYRQAKRDAAAASSRQPARLKRARTSDSMVVQGMAGSQGEETSETS